MLLVASLLLPGQGQAAPSSHDPRKLQQRRAAGDITDPSVVGRREVCHTLDAGEGEPGTSFIASSARTLHAMRLHRGASFAPAEHFGCTFCHSNLLDNASMDAVLSNFASTVVKHPVGRKVDGTTKTNNEYLSADDSPEIAGTPAEAELPCVGCHEPALLTYPTHEGRTTDPAGWTGVWDAAANPSALQNVAAPGEKDKRGCVDTCHMSSAGAAGGPVEEETFLDEGGVDLREVTGCRVYAGPEPFDPAAPGDGGAGLPFPLGSAPRGGASAPTRGRRAPQSCRRFPA